MSSARFHPTRSASILCGLPWRIEASSSAASRLFAAPIAWMSPVKWRFRSSIGTTCVIPPPAAPPLMPNTGPEGGLAQTQQRVLADVARAPASAPTAVVVFPSPAFVGVTPATQTIFPSGWPAIRSITPRSTFAL